MHVQDRGAENSMPKLREVIGGTKTKIYWQGTVYLRCILTALQTSNWAWLRLKIKQNHC